MTIRFHGAAVLGGLTLSAVAAGQCAPNAGAGQWGNVTCSTNYRQVNISGATLFRAFFQNASSTNDWIDVDGNGCKGFGEAGCSPLLVQQLALAGTASVPPDPNSTWWAVQYRGVGSVNGFTEFVNYQVCGDLPEVPPTEPTSNLNRIAFGAAGTGYTGDNDGDGVNNNSGTLVAPCSIDIAVLDVPSLWAIAKGSTGNARWNRTPLEDGYGKNPAPGFVLAGCTNPGPANNMLRSLTATCSNPPGNSPLDISLKIVDSPVVFAPIVPIANRGVGYDYVTYSELQFLAIGGRMPNGENLASGGRDVGSGTRNGWANSIGVDPSWANNDNEGSESSASSAANLGPCHRITNMGSNSHTENGIQNRRIGIAYDGLAGTGGAADDSNLGLYEILGVIKDIDGATQVVRPTVSAILDNSDPTTGYQIGGYETFVTVGNPFQLDPNAADAMKNCNARDYIRNIVTSVQAFSANPGQPDANLSPGQYLANAFFPLHCTDFEQDISDGTNFFPDGSLNQTLQDYVRANSNLGVAALPKDGIVTPGYHYNVSGKVPNRTLGAYRYTTAGGGILTINAGQDLGRRNRIQGDFNYDDKRDINDAAKLMAAIYTTLTDPNGAAAYTEPGAPLTPPTGSSYNGGQASDVIIVDVLGDFDGNGAFDASDIRYWADGLALVADVSGDRGYRLDRKQGFTAVDNNWAVGTTGHPAGNFFNATVKNPCTGATIAYTAGTARFDVAGSTTGAFKGASPKGADGLVDATDFNYILANFGDWANKDDAARIDLSCDMNGDLKVDANDMYELINHGWGLPTGDLDCNGCVDLSDLTVILGNYGLTGATYWQGDLTFDGTVNLSDVALALSLYGSGC